MRLFPACIFVAVLSGSVCSVGFAFDDDGKPTATFESSVKAVLQKRCAECHSGDEPDEGLRLTEANGIAAGSQSGAVIVPGNLDESLLWRRIESDSMPPEGSADLTPDEKRIVRDWIKQGAMLDSGRSVVAESVSTDAIVALMHLRCTACHGHRRQEADLDLRTPEGMLKGGRSGPAIVPGHAGRSLIVKHIEALEMPPPRDVVSVSVKPMQTDEIAKLRRWIDAGAPVDAHRTKQPGSHSETELASRAANEEKHWAFQPIRRPPVPSSHDGMSASNEIDAFLLRDLMELGLSYAPRADRSRLVRRLHIDMLGLLPPPGIVEQFVADNRPDAWERQVDRVLASPHYGERWGRHWLDLAGYSDSEGVQNSDLIREHAWRYRDYVIRSLNADKSYDGFLLEQIAGDELADYRNAETMTQELYDNLVATGFLRMGIDGTFADITNFVPDRLEVIHREVEVLATSVMGLTVQCARCHSHKFDPVSQHDYYRLLAVFKGAYDEHDWLKPTRQGAPPGEKDRLLPFVTSTERAEWESEIARIDQLIRRRESEPETEQRNSILKTLKDSRPPEPLVRALWDRNVPSPTFVLIRGNYLTPGDRVGPGVPGFLTGADSQFEVQPPSWGGSSGRRLAFARWLVHDKHPLTARVIANRVWLHHFGHGLVNTPDNFGRAGQQPSHPELLDWLASELVEQGWSLKALHRLILTSRVYQQSTVSSATSRKLDPDNSLLSRMPMRRMDAEVLRDNLIRLAGKLRRRLYGPGDPVDVNSEGLVTSRPVDGTWRRSIYVLQRRSQIPTLLENFDLPQMSPNCVERRIANVAPQALQLLNDQFVNQMAHEMASRVTTGHARSPEEQIESLYLLAYGRSPTKDETRICSKQLIRLEEAWRRDGEGAPESAAFGAMRNLCRVILNSAEFLYVD